MLTTYEYEYEYEYYIKFIHLKTLSSISHMQLQSLNKDMLIV